MHTKNSAAADSGASARSGHLGALALAVVSASNEPSLLQQLLPFLCSCTQASYQRPRPRKSVGASGRNCEKEERERESKRRRSLELGTLASLSLSLGAGVVLIEWRPVPSSSSSTFAHLERRTCAQQSGGQYRGCKNCLHLLVAVDSGRQCWSRRESALSCRFYFYFSANCSRPPYARHSRGRALLLSVHLCCTTLLLEQRESASLFHYLLVSTSPNCHNTHEHKHKHTVHNHTSTAKTGQPIIG